jgi:dolichol-phosphate mannosyltransferase
MVSILFIGGIQLLSIGIIGEYISRLITNVRNRPLYIIDETNVEKEN